jgi:hypothetical protein
MEQSSAYPAQSNGLNIHIFSHRPQRLLKKLTWPNPALTNALTNVAAKFCLAESRLELAPRPSIK